MKRHKVSGQLPEAIYVVSWGYGYKLYSKLSAARGIITNDRKYYPNAAEENRPKIYEVNIDGFTEVQ